MKKLFIIAIIAAACITVAAQDSLLWVSDTMTVADSVQVEEMASITSTTPVQIEPAAGKQSSTSGWAVPVCGITALLAVGAGVMAYITRRELNDLKRTVRAELDNTDENMRRLADESAREVNALRLALSTRLTSVQSTPAQASVLAKPGNATPEAVPSSRKAAKQDIYLAKPDANDCFTRAGDRFELGNSLFLLTTTHGGAQGTFVVIDNADAQRFALMMPAENLTRACAGDGIQISTGKTRIVTDVPGEAVLDNGLWRITRKAMIHYE